MAAGGPPRCERHEAEYQQQRQQNREPWQRSTPRRQPGGNGWEWQRIRQRILKRDNHTCFYCGGAATVVDHVQGVTADGSDDDSNLVACCKPCNEEKRKREAAAGRERNRQQRRQ